ncbi:uncharacterized protein RSE6_09398 [Rhynchosporium secalis]|uniref:Non-haem dioxygenase N-terminal domain-containing protein n=1 Tax=Rhynchosporium secalis TaxID=38038 RepID=A0A1E1MHW7_RHYSE|nr:uncharacterized protein RSE6_09398 [Rhynchosporium secalis]
MISFGLDQSEVNSQFATSKELFNIDVVGNLEYRADLEHGGNIADFLSFRTNGYLKSSIHRAVAPSLDQALLDRMGALYFFRPEYDLELKTIPSPFLQRLGLDQVAEGEELTAGGWARDGKNVNKDGDTPEENGEQKIIERITAN